MLTFHERFGEVSVAQLRAYKRHNVSQSDHDALVAFYGENAHVAITKVVKNSAYQQGQSFSEYLWRTRLHLA